MDKKGIKTTPTARGNGARLAGYPWGFLAVTASTGLALLLSRYLRLDDLVMIHLVGVVIVSLRFGVGASVFTAVLAALSFDFFSIPPAFIWAAPDLKSSITFLVMTAVAAIVSGLGQRTRRQQALAQVREIEMETERLRNSLLSAVSHDLRTPLAAIFGAGTELVRDGARLDPESRDGLARSIVEEAERLEQLVTNLLDVARLEGGAVDIGKRNAALDEVIEEALARLRGRLGSRPVHTHVPEEVPLVPMDAVLVRQVFVNLLENAIRYTPQGSKLEVDVSVDGAFVVVEVRDEGPGIEGSGEQLFERFQRGRATSDGGVGLGLTICRSIVDAHGGSITIANRAPRGALVRFTLPLGASRIPEAA